MSETFADKLRAALAPARDAAGKITREAWDRVVNETHEAALVAAGKRAPRKKRDPAEPKPPKPRNPLFDALATETGCRDLTQLTKNASRAVGVALADIRAVTPDLTVEEIQRRARLYRKRWPDPRNLSATALSKHWHEFAQASDEEKTRAAKMDVYQEPAAPWRPTWIRQRQINMKDAEIAAIVNGKRWLELDTNDRRAILEEMHRI